VLGRQITQPDLAFLVAEQSGRVVGHACVHAEHLPRLRLGRLYVLPAEQRHGIGTRLLTAAIDRYPQARCMALVVQAENAKAVAFYAKHGFVTRDRAVADGIAVLRMEKVLGL
jgi:ribosomal protein S18 acetylase RimI-like enzyme